MSSKLIASIQLIILGLSALLALSGQATASTTDWGAQAVPVSRSFGNTFTVSQSQFHDDYLFSIPAASFNSISSTISLGNYFGISNLQTRLYSGTVTTINTSSGLLHAWSTEIPVSVGGLGGTLAVISPITLSSGNYIMEVRGDVVGTAGGSYSGILNISPVPEAGEWMFLLVGFSMIGFIAARRNRSAWIESEANRPNRQGAKVIDVFIHALSWGDTLSRIAAWSRARESRYVCICNVHSVMTVSQNSKFKRVVSQADMATPDGMPIAWMLRRQGFLNQERINGPDLMWKYCEQAARNGEIVYFYGSTNETLQRLSVKLLAEFPDLCIGGIHSPPFHEESEAEDEAVVAAINSSGAGVVFIGLGCPKQEMWMAAHRNRIQAVMIGVGAAFDYHAGTVQRAPLWMQRSGLEWLYRLYSEPRRLWKRYFVTNTLFIIWAAVQLLGHFLGNAPKVGEAGFSIANH